MASRQDTGRPAKRPRRPLPVPVDCPAPCGAFAFRPADGECGNEHRRFLGVRGFPVRASQRPWRIHPGGAPRGQRGGGPGGLDGRRRSAVRQGGPRAEAGIRAEDGAGIRHGRHGRRRSAPGDAAPVVLGERPDGRPGEGALYQSPRRSPPKPENRSRKTGGRTRDAVGEDAKRCPAEIICGAAMYRTYDSAPECQAGTGTDSNRGRRRFIPLVLDPTWR